MAKRQNLEQKLQIACVRWFRYQYPKFIKGLHSNNNNAASRKISGAAIGGIMKAMGTVSGVADLELCYNGRVYFIEMKSPKGRQSPDQMEFQKYVQSQGFDYVIIRSFEEFMMYISKIMIQEITGKKKARYVKL